MSRRDKQARLDALAQLKRVRSGGTRVIEEEDDQIYDEISESRYKQIVKGRLQEDDFVVDDGVAGYMDNGVEDWGDAEDYESSDEEKDTKKKGPQKKKGKNGTKGSKPKAPPPPVTKPAISAYRPKPDVNQEDSFMASLNESLDNAVVPQPTAKSRKRKPFHGYDSGSGSSPITPYRKATAYADNSSDGFEEPNTPLVDSSDDDFMKSPKKKVKTSTAGMSTPAIERFASMDVHSSSDGPDKSMDDIDIDSFFQDDGLENEDVKPTIFDQGKKSVKFATTPSILPKQEEEEQMLPSWLSVYDSLPANDNDTIGFTTVPGSSTGESGKISALEDDGSLRFFWLDYLEHEGRIFFVGKLKDKQTGQWLSCSVCVENLERNLFVLPRPRRVEYDENRQPVETDEVPEKSEIYADFDQLRRKRNIKSFKGKFVKRNYAFGDSDVPRGESDWLKVLYPFTEPALPTNAESPNIARIFGANTSAFELLVLKRKIFGPCWLEIKHPEVEHKGFSWCKFEATVTDPKDINPFPDSDLNAPKEMPPLTVMSLSVRTIINHHENKQEVVCVTARTWHSLTIDDPTPPDRQPASVQTIVRPLDKFPPRFEEHAKATGKGMVTAAQNERMLLMKLLMTIHKADPDVLVGHDFLGVSLDVLLHRMKEVKADHWSRIGRFRRPGKPNIGKQGTNMKFLSGRMLCDLASDGAKSMISSTTWSMTEMCKTHLKSDRIDIDPDDTASYFDSSVSSPEHLMNFVRHCELDAYYQMAIASRVQILPLTKQLTNLAGNSWNKTLNGGRAERNEYILLHEFHRLKYICPDKSYGSKAVVKSEPVDDDPDALKDNQKTTKGRKDKYKGGLVFEPKRGLWDKYILVMDFNSLYPSIIQEYNIDFTTIDKPKGEVDDNGEEVQAELPNADSEQGVLPRLIAKLVQRRRQVKSLMKDKGITDAQRLQYDVKQQALKLTANSMYGCLGFEYSRFYARQLASLTTFKGREILMHTRELAESMSLDVVYGDTDSVFVNSNADDFSDALRVSAEFKKAVNERYKLLEIDLDGIFKRLLLLQKKKYAALKMEDKSRTSMEVKGLDMKRREFSPLSKEISQKILDRILSGEATEVVVEQIHDYLREIGDKIRGGQIKLEEFIINKRLGKNPEEYPKTDGQPHVKVALKMKARGGNARGGDVIPYVFCLEEGQETAKSGSSDRAHHPDELRRADSTLRIDYEYYLSQQILPPIDRLCDPIEGTDRPRLAECLGLDPNKFKSTAPGAPDERAFATLESQMSDAERFKDAAPFLVRCRACKGQFEFGPLYDPQKSIVRTSGPQCPNVTCSQTITVGSLLFQLESQIRALVEKYYEAWLVCDDPVCGGRTREMSVYGRRCLRPDCRGHVFHEYSDAALYTQLKYYSSLFDPQTIVNGAADPRTRESLNALTHQLGDFLSVMNACVEKYMDQCGRRWVDMSSIFSFMMKIK